MLYVPTWYELLRYSLKNHLRKNEWPGLHYPANKITVLATVYLFKTKLYYGILYKNIFKV